MVSRRTFAASAVARADIIQDMYLKELKGFKPAPIKASDADAHVQKFKIPAAPASPEDIDVAKELKEYEAQQPEVEGQAGEAGATPVEQDWFEQPEEDEPAHH
ncbi:hypothetical protein AMS68_000570 [Peltaster fructicola]|uniref:ATP synthase subunit H, mitochondrial n=1 Tax=Peltaster fructicola TaxID=286661 RepID=A0A6H0XJZ2_9PEZI|nr:hypothetical protein AMS68_000570 [Peltaster fructicola]